MRRRSVPTRLMLAAAVAGLLAAACGTGPPDHVRIGVVAPLTGPRAFLGQELVQGVRLAIDDLNDAGGLLGERVELVVEDDGDLVRLPGQLADLAERSRVSAIIGPEAPAILLGPRSPLSRRAVPAVLASAFAGDLSAADTTVVRT
ncbi:MAG TPA: ABC transporter substrate-binding protein, partial [Nitriliruptorales bacterium]